MFNPFEMMSKARELQEKMQQMQENLARQRVSADAGGGMVQATVSGKLELVAIKIDKTRINSGDAELLEDVIVSAVAAAQAKAKEMMRQEMQRVAGDAGLPPGLADMLPQERNSNDETRNSNQ